MKMCPHWPRRLMSRAASRAARHVPSRLVDAISTQFWRPLPAELEPLYEMLDLRTEDERRPLRVVATEWTEVGGLINVRALGEMVKARVIAEKNKQTAIDRENKRRSQQQLQVVHGGRS